MPKTSAKSKFTARVLAIVKRIPKGSILTYKEVARRAGNVNASRAVGSILKKNFSTDVPCHRVIRSDGTLGGYNGLLQKNKKRLLHLEGAKIPA